MCSLRFDLLSSRRRSTRVRTTASASHRAGEESLHPSDLLLRPSLVSVSMTPCGPLWLSASNTQHCGVLCHPLTLEHFPLSLDERKRREGRQALSRRSWLRPRSLVTVWRVRAGCFICSCIGPCCVPPSFRSIFRFFGPSRE